LQDIIIADRLALEFKIFLPVLAMAGRHHRCHGNRIRINGNRIAVTSLQDVNTALD
jgi:hypothetical protein